MGTPAMGGPPGGAKLAGDAGGGRKSCGRIGAAGIGTPAIGGSAGEAGSATSRRKGTPSS
jgi:hypothetical protein